MSDDNITDPPEDGRPAFRLLFAADHAISLIHLALDDLENKRGRRGAKGSLRLAVRFLEGGLRTEKERAIRDLSAVLREALPPGITGGELEGAHTILDTIQAALPRGLRDRKILARFHDWVDAERASAAIAEPDEPENQAAFEAACDHADELAQAVARVPAESLIGVVIKAYVAAHDRTGGRPGDAAGFTPNASTLEGSFLRDAGRLVPELAPLVAAVSTAGQEDRS